MKTQRPPNNPKNLKKKNRTGSIMLPDFEYKIATIIKMILYLHKK